jgi:hypothetical protein
LEKGKATAMGGFFLLMLVLLEVPGLDRPDVPMIKRLNPGTAPP